MRKFIYLLWVTLFASSALVLSSCSKDDDKNGEENIIGSWECVDNLDDDPSYETSTDYFQFRSDYTFYSIWVGTRSGRQYVEIDYGHWSVSGKKLYLDFDEGEPPAAFDYNLKKDKLTFSVNGMKASFTRIPDSQINGYINDFLGR